MSDNDNNSGPAMLVGKHHDITAFASTDETRFALCGVHYNAKEKRLEATDGNMAIRVPVCERVEDFPVTKAGEATLADCIIPIPAFKRALGNIKDAAKNARFAPILAHAKLSGNGDGKVTFATTDNDTEQAVTAKWVDAQYPNVAQCWPIEEPKLSIELSANILRRIADYAEKCSKSDATGNVAVRLEFTDSTSAVRFSFYLENALGEEVKAEGIAMPMRLS